jgi:hypothetical protein
MRGTLDQCVLVSLRTLESGVARLVPRGLQLITRQHPETGETFAFWNIVLCHVDRMRPVGAPHAMGISYHHIAYRLMVEADDGSDAGHARTQGLYFVRSDADRAMIRVGGNLVSEFRFQPSLVERAEAAGIERWRVRSRDHSGDLDAAFSEDTAELAEGSPFASMDEARSFLKYRPMGLAPDDEGRRLRLAEVFRDEAAWNERPVSVIALRSAYLESLGEGGAVVEMATRVAPIDYRWRLGRSESIKFG